MHSTVWVDHSDLLWLVERKSVLIRDVEKGLTAGWAPTDDHVLQNLLASNLVVLASGFGRLALSVLMNEVVAYLDVSRHHGVEVGSVHLLTVMRLVV